MKVGTKTNTSQYLAVARPTVPPGSLLTEAVDALPKWPNITPVPHLLASRGNFSYTGGEPQYFQDKTSKHSYTHIFLLHFQYAYRWNQWQWMWQHRWEAMIDNPILPHCPNVECSKSCSGRLLRLNFKCNFTGTVMWTCLSRYTVG